MEATKTNQKEPPKEKKKPEGKALNGTEQPSNWEKAAEMIAGNNQLMATLLKLLLSPLTVRSFAHIYCLWAGSLLVLGVTLEIRSMLIYSN